MSACRELRQHSRQSLTLKRTERSSQRESIESSLIKFDYRIDRLLQIKKNGSIHSGDYRENLFDRTNCC